MRNYFLALCITVLSSISHAESYLNIQKFDSLARLKAKFPNAVFTREFPAWASESELLYTMEGQGLGGTIVLKFFDPRSFAKEAAKHANGSVKENLELTTKKSLEDAAHIIWVRLVPDSRIPVKNITMRYGKPEKSGVSDTYEPYLEWTKKGITASLSEDKKFVNMIQFNKLD